MKNFENLQKLNYTLLTLGEIYFGPYLGQGLQNYTCTPSHIILKHNQ